MLTQQLRNIHINLLTVRRILRHIHHLDVEPRRKNRYAEQRQRLHTSEHLCGGQLRLEQVLDVGDGLFCEEDGGATADSVGQDQHQHEQVYAQDLAVGFGLAVTTVQGVHLFDHDLDVLVGAAASAFLLFS